jgi:hypothetical protein
MERGHTTAHPSLRALHVGDALAVGAVAAPATQVDEAAQRRFALGLVAIAQVRAQAPLLLGCEDRAEPGLVRPWRPDGLMEGDLKEPEERQL